LEQTKGNLNPKDPTGRILPLPATANTAEDFAWNELPNPVVSTVSKGKKVPGSNYLAPIQRIVSDQSSVHITSPFSGVKGIDWSEAQTQAEQQIAGYWERHLPTHGPSGELLLRSMASFEVKKGPHTGRLVQPALVRRRNAELEELGKVYKVTLSPGKKLPYDIRQALIEERKNEIVGAGFSTVGTSLEQHTTVRYVAQREGSGLKSKLKVDTSLVKKGGYLIGGEGPGELLEERIEPHTTVRYVAQREGSGLKGKLKVGTSLVKKFGYLIGGEGPGELLEERTGWYVAQREGGYLISWEGPRELLEKRIESYTTVRYVAQRKGSGLNSKLKVDTSLVKKGRYLIGWEEQRELLPFPENLDSIVGSQWAVSGQHPIKVDVYEGEGSERVKVGTRLIEHTYDERIAHLDIPRPITVATVRAAEARAKKREMYAAQNSVTALFSVPTRNPRIGDFVTGKRLDIDPGSIGRLFNQLGVPGVRIRTIDPVSNLIDYETRRAFLPDLGTRTTTRTGVTFYERLVPPGQIHAAKERAIQILLNIRRNQLHHKTLGTDPSQGTRTTLLMEKYEQQLRNKDHISVINEYMRRTLEQGLNRGALLTNDTSITLRSGDRMVGGRRLPQPSLTKAEITHLKSSYGLTAIQAKYGGIELQYPGLRSIDQVFDLLPARIQHGLASGDIKSQVRAQARTAWKLEYDAAQRALHYRPLLGMSEDPYERQKFVAGLLAGSSSRKRVHTSRRRVVGRSVKGLRELPGLGAFPNTPEGLLETLYPKGAEKMHLEGTPGKEVLRLRHNHWETQERILNALNRGEKISLLFSKKGPTGEILPDINAAFAFSNKLMAGDFETSKTFFESNMSKIRRKNLALKSLRTFIEDSSVARLSVVRSAEGRSAYSVARYELARTGLATLQAAVTSGDVSIGDRSLISALTAVADVAPIHKYEELSRKLNFAFTSLVGPEENKLLAVIKANETTENTLNVRMLRNKTSPLKLIDEEEEGYPPELLTAEEHIKKRSDRWTREIHPLQSDFAPEERAYSFLSKTQEGPFLSDTNIPIAVRKGTFFGKGRITKQGYSVPVSEEMMDSLGPLLATGEPAKFRIGRLSVDVADLRYERVPSSQVAAETWPSKMLSEPPYESVKSKEMRAIQQSIVDRLKTIEERKRGIAELLANPQEESGTEQSLNQLDRLLAEAHENMIEKQAQHMKDLDDLEAMLEKNYENRIENRKQELQLLQHSRHEAALKALLDTDPGPSVVEAPPVGTTSASQVSVINKSIIESAHEEANTINSSLSPTVAATSETTFVQRAMAAGNMEAAATGTAVGASTAGPGVPVTEAILKRLGELLSSLWGKGEGATFQRILVGGVAGVAAASSISSMFGTDVQEGMGPVMPQSAPLPPQMPRYQQGPRMQLPPPRAVLMHPMSRSVRENVMISSRAQPINLMPTMQQHGLGGGMRVSYEDYRSPGTNGSLAAGFNDIDDNRIWNP